MELVTSNCNLSPTIFCVRIASASQNVFARCFGHCFACSSLSKIITFRWTRCKIWRWHNPPPTSFSQYKQSRTFCSQGQQSQYNMEMKRRDHTVNSNRRVSPHVLSTVYCGEFANAAVTLPSRSLASRCGKHGKIIPRTFLFNVLPPHSYCADYIIFIKNILGKQIKMWSISTLFWAMTWPEPPPRTSGGGSADSLPMSF